jgi:hypothetical protein
MSVDIGNKQQKYETNSAVDSAVCLVTRLQIEKSGVRIAQGARSFCLIQNVQTGVGAHPASYSVGTGGSFLGSKAVEF